MQTERDRKFRNMQTEKYGPYQVYANREGQNISDIYKHGAIKHTRKSSYELSLYISNSFWMPSI